MKKLANEFLVKKEAKDIVTEGIFDSFRKNPKKKLEDAKLEMAQLSTKISSILDNLEETGINVPEDIKKWSLIIQSDLISLSAAIKPEREGFGTIKNAQKLHKDLKMPTGERQPGFPGLTTTNKSTFSDPSEYGAWQDEELMAEELANAEE